MTPEQRLESRTRALEAANEVLRQSRQSLAAELDAAEHLQSVATQLIGTRGAAELYEKILDSAQAILHSDFASIQMLYPERGSHGELRLLGYRGFSEEAAKRWEWVSPATRTSCGEALRTRERVIVPDVRGCEFMAGSEEQKTYLSAGVEAVQTTPLISRSGDLVGMVSTHWRAPHEPAASELRALDVLGRMAADLIERSRVEGILRENQQRLASIYNSVKDAIFHVAVEPEGQFRFVSVNEAFLKVTGLSREMVAGRTVNEVIPEPSLTMVLGKYRQALEEKTVVRWEETSDYPVGRLTGEVSVVPVFNNQDACTHLVGSLHDVTERKQVEAARRETELRYKEVFDNFSECIFVLDVDSDGRFKIASLNSAEEKAVGLSNADVAGKYIDEIFPEELANRVIAHYRQCVEAGTLIHYDEELELPGGGRYFHTNLFPLRNPAGRIHRLVGCCMDFTDLKRSQESAFARQKLESVGTLANGIAHDFNNILGAVLAQAQVAVEEIAAGSRPLEELKAICEVAMRGSEIVRQLMVYAGKGAEVSGLVDVSRVVEDMLELLRVLISKRANLVMDLERRPTPVHANAVQISQLLINLVTNASEAIGDQDGTIQVITRRVNLGPDAPEVDRVAEGEYVQLEVSDSGRGMPPETRARVFDPFYTTKSGGRGLGLAVVDGIVRRLGGAIHLTSEPGRGTTFRISVPCAETTMKGKAANPGDPLQSFPVTTVLLVEDEELLRQATSKMLQKHGFSVIEARDGSAALDLIRGQDNTIHVLFLDITIPGASAWEVLEEARSLRPEMKVIVTSAYSREMASALLHSTIEHFLRKPYRIRDLIELIRPN